MIAGQVEYRDMVSSRVVILIRVGFSNVRFIVLFDLDGSGQLPSCLGKPATRAGW